MQSPRRQRLHSLIRSVVAEDDSSNEVVNAALQQFARAAERQTKVSTWAVSHLAKETHSSSDCFGPVVLPSAMPPRPEISSGDCKDVLDVVGIKTKLMKLAVSFFDGEQVMQLARRRDGDLIALLSYNADDAEILRTELALENPPRIASNSRAKLIYWCIDNNPLGASSFDLLEPITSVAMMQAIALDHRKWSPISSVKDAPKDLPHYRYAGTAMRTLGGANPINISSLTASVRGELPMLASLPPKWLSAKAVVPAEFKGIAVQLEQSKYLFASIARLARFLSKKQPANVKSRNRQRRLEANIAAEITGAAAIIRSGYPAGWTRGVSEAVLPCERAWLDPARRALEPSLSDESTLGDDSAFNAFFDSQQWRSEVLDLVTRWVSVRIRRKMKNKERLDEGSVTRLRNVLAKQIFEGCEP